MKFTIAIPVRNGEKYLKQAIESAVSQIRMPDEILIVDDASTDSTAEIAKSADWGRLVRYVYNDRPTGYADAFNRVFEYASGDYVTLLAYDDLLDTNFLLYVERAFNAYKEARHCFVGYHYITDTGAITSSSPWPHTTDPVLYSGRDYSHRYLEGVRDKRHINRCLGFVTQRKLFLEQCRFRKEAGLITDDDFFVRIGAFTDVVGISAPLTSVRVHSDSETGRLHSLVEKLATDYLFQVRWYSNNVSHIDEYHVRIIYSLAVHFISDLLYYGLKAKNIAQFEKALNYKREMKLLVPGYFDDQIKGWRRVLWQLVGNKISLHANMFVHMISFLASTKNNFKRILK